MTEIADRYRRLAARVTERAEAVPDDAWENASPCPGWTARDVVRHLVETPSHFTTSVGLELPDVDVDADPVAAWTTTSAAVQGFLDDPETAGRTYESRFGTTSFQDSVDGFISLDLVVHGWDLATATGGDTSIPDADAQRVLDAVTSMGDMARGEGAFGPVVEVPDDAPVADRMLGVCGRTP